jgi:pimeloyl-ACP methyl ester carboxylesterase
MARIDINGIGIEYELRGPEGAPPIVLTPGGRFSMTTPGLSELADELVAGGKRVLLWDRPNCGQSDISFDGITESRLHADTLAGLIRALGLGPCALAAGSAGSRVSLITAAHHPDVVSHLVLWWISGGPIGTIQLGMIYCGESANLVVSEGYKMEAALKAYAWADQLSQNPRMKDQLLALDPHDYVAKMQKWAAAYAPPTTSPVPGMTPETFAGIDIPVLILRSGSTDLAHTRETTDWVHELLPNSTMMDPPWGDNEWNERTRAVREGKEKGLFVNWPKTAPQILEFTA